MNEAPCITGTDPLYPPEPVAEYIGVKMVTLEKWRQNGRGPAFIRVGRLVRYRQSDLDRWLESQRVAGGAVA